MGWERWEWRWGIGEGREGFLVGRSGYPRSRGKGEVGAVPLGLLFHLDVRICAVAGACCFAKICVVVGSGRYILCAESVLRAN